MMNSIGLTQSLGQHLCAYRTTANGMQQALLRSMHPQLLFSVHSLFKVLISIAHHQQYCYSTGVILFVCKLIASW